MSNFQEQIEATNCVTLTRIDADKLRNAMKSQRWNGRQLGIAVGLSPYAVDHWLRGKSVPSAVNLKLVCDKLGLNIADLFVEETFERAAA